MTVVRRGLSGEPTSRQRLRGAVQLAGAGFERVTRRVHELHRAIAALSFDWVEAVPAVTRGGRLARLIYDGITDGTYASVRLGGRALFAATTFAMKTLEVKATIAAAEPHNAATAPPSPAYNVVDSVLNGTFGDFMAAQRNPLTARLGFYADGRRLLLTREALAAAHPNATDRLAIFVHGLWCNEDCWTSYVQPDDLATRPYAHRLADDLGFTPYFVRYNPGLHVSQNGRLLARAIARLVDVHPVPVREVVLIGHSMGGLVSRAACHVAARRGAAWSHRLSNVVCIGTPHLGAPLERVAHVGAGVLDAFSLTRPLAALLNARSRGIQDLRYGYVSDDDWRGRHPRTQYAAGRKPIARVTGARYHFIGSSLGRSARDPLGWVVGDGMVRVSSSTPRELADTDTATVFGVHHMRLVNHPAVYAELRARLLPRDS